MLRPIDILIQRPIRPSGWYSRANDTVDSLQRSSSPSRTYDRLVAFVGSRLRPRASETDFAQSHESHPYGPLHMSHSTRTIGRSISLSKPRAIHTHRRSGTISSLSQTSSETMLSDSQSDDAKSIEEPPPMVVSIPAPDDVPARQTLNRANGHVPQSEPTHDSSPISDPAPTSIRQSQPETQSRPSSPRGAIKSMASNSDLPGRTSTSAQSPRMARPNDSRMMHQTSSKLLRMTADDRPFTRVRSSFPSLFS